MARFCIAAALALAVAPSLAAQSPAPIVLHAARLLQVDTGQMLAPGEILVVGDRIRAVGTTVEHPQGAQIILLLCAVDYRPAIAEN